MTDSKLEPINGLIAQAVRHYIDLRWYVGAICRYQCEGASEELVSQFPTSLRRVRGHVVELNSGNAIEHWWCESSKGEVFDPTWRQFNRPEGNIYYELPDDAPEPTGECQWCRRYLWEAYPDCTELCIGELSFIRHADQVTSGY